MSCCGGSRRGDIRGRRIVYVVFTRQGQEDSQFELITDALARKEKLGTGAFVRPIKRWP